MELPDYYAILGVSEQADRKTIERAYRALARQFHPDVNPSPDAHQRMAAINEAYQVLRDPQRRERYNAARALHQRLQKEAPLEIPLGRGLATEWMQAVSVQNLQWQQAWRQKQQQFQQQVEYLFRARGYEVLHRRPREDDPLFQEVLFRRRREQVLIGIDFSPIVIPSRIRRFVDGLEKWPQASRIAYFGRQDFVKAAVRLAKDAGIFVYNGPLLKQVYAQTLRRYGRRKRA